MRAAPVGTKNKKRIALGFLIVAVLLLLLTFRVAYWPIIKGEWLTEKAIAQQTQDTPIEAKRGAIYDRNGKELATSITCYTLWARPAQVKTQKGKTITAEQIAAIASQIAEITGRDAETVQTNLTKSTALVRIASNLDKETADAVRALKLNGLELAEGTKRYYPLGNFASQLLGSVSADNTGRAGIELEYDQYLAGVSGRWKKNTDLLGNELVEGAEEYHEAQDGYNVVLSLDEAIQYYVEKALEKGMEKTKAKRIMCLVMNPKTGEILASATTPGYDPNEPMDSKNVPEAQAEAYEKMSADEKQSYLISLWRNPVISDTYEPGSTFKLLTSSSALEEKVIDTHTTFQCAGSFTVAGVRLHCWTRGSHGTQTIRQAIGNSCNPALAKVATLMGKQTFYKYLGLYGITEKTGVDYPGEAGSIMYALKDVGPVELATIGYGQSISVTPIQLLTAVNAIGNDGVLLQPHYVKALTDSDGKVVKEFEPTIVRKVLSAKTAKEMRSIMQYVVDEGGGGNARIAGYRVGGKTGTANKIDAGTGKYGKDYYSSFIGMAPMDDPQVSILVVVDSPRGSYYGSMVAAPIAKEILTDTLRYLNVTPTYSASEKKAIEGNYTIVPNVIGKPFSEAVGIIGGKELKYSRPKSTQDDDEFTVVDQYPKAGTKVKKNSVVYVYKE